MKFFIELPNIIKRNRTLFIFSIAFLIRAWNIGADLPNLYIADEPHHLHLAAHFSTGDLNPHDFKYPTLWNYLLSGMLGVIFLIGKILGLVNSSSDFASAFFYSPTVVYLLARLLAAAFFAGASCIFYRIGVKYYDEATGLAAAAFAALAPPLWFFGRDATMNSLMFFLVTWGLYFVHEIQAKEGRSPYIKSGLLLGLAISTHYIAAPVPLLLISTHFLPNKKNRVFTHLIAGLLFVAVGFVLGSPFFLLDFKKALSDVLGMGQLHIVSMGHNETSELGKRSVHLLWLWLQIIKNLFSFLDGYGIGLILILIAVIRGASKGTFLKVLAWFIPAIATSLLLLNSYHGNYYRYSLGAYIPLLIPAAIGFSEVWNGLKKQPWLRWLILMSIASLFIRFTYINSRDLALPDTRTQAKSWLVSHVPTESKILITDPFNGPQIILAKSQVDKLLQKTQASHHPREHFYRALQHNHPGGGHTVYYLRRGLVEVEDMPNRTEQAYEGMDTLDLANDGFTAAEKAGIKTIVLCKWLETLRNQQWISELRKNCLLTLSFIPDLVYTKGAPLEIYTCPDQPQQSQNR